MLKEWKTEWMKVRYRRIGLLLLLFLAVIFFWCNWGTSDLPANELWDGYRRLFMQFPIISSVVIPTMTAMLASRLCDAEGKGGMLKLLCTMEKKGRLFDMKFLIGAVYLGIFVAAELLIIFAMGTIYGFGQPIEIYHILYFIAEIYFVSLALLLLQEVLSFFFENQIIPLAVGIFGSFMGLFAWFFPGSPIRFLFIWGFYSLLGFINFNWNEETRVMTYYDVPFETPYFILLLAILAVSYLAARWFFIRKEI